MPPTLALLLCIIFVLVMLRLDRKQSPEVSFALWIPTIWILLIGSKPLAIWFGSGGATLEEGSELDRVVLTCLLFAGLIILAKRHFYWSNALKENIWLVLVIGYMLVSVIWSNIPFVSVKRWSRELIVVVMAFVVATEPDPRKALESVFRRMIYILIPFSYVLIQYFGEYGRIYVHNEGVLMWTGVALHKNSLGQLCLFGGIFIIWAFLRRWRGMDISAVTYQKHIEACLFLLILWLMGGPQHDFAYSTTSFIALLLGSTALIGLFLIRKHRSVAVSNIFIVILVLVIAYGTVTPLLGRLSLIDVSSMFGRNETLTGRSAIWAILVPFAMQKPILGHGFGGFWNTEMRELSTVTQAHNGYLDVVLNVGFLGLLLLSIFILSCSRKAQRAMAEDFDWAALWICYLLLVVVHNITETSISAFSNYLMALLLFQLVCIPDYRKIS